MPRTSDPRAWVAEQCTEVLPFLKSLNAHMNRPLSLDDLHDVAQDTALALLRSAQRIREVRSPGAYTKGTARFAYITALRKRTARREVLCEDPTPKTEGEVAHNQACGVVHSALAVLSERERQTLRAHLWKGLVFREIASEEGRAEAAVKATYYRALRKLRQRIPHPTLR